MIIEIITIILIIFGFVIFLKLTFYNNPIIFFKLIDNDKDVSFYINNPGKYAISTVKGKFVTITNGFKIRINQNFKSSSDLLIQELKIRNKTYTKWHIGIEFLSFKIIDEGSYSLKIEGADNLIVKEPRFATKQRILDEIKKDEIELAIEKYYPFYHRIFAVILIIIGLVGLIWKSI